MKNAWLGGLFMGYISWLCLTSCHPASFRRSISPEGPAPRVERLEAVMMTRHDYSRHLLVHSSPHLIPFRSVARRAPPTAEKRKGDEVIR